jgi:uncharacterized protein YlxW (UPF0749 family)
MDNTNAIFVMWAIIATLMAVFFAMRRTKSKEIQQNASTATNDSQGFVALQQKLSLAQKNLGQLKEEIQKKDKALEAARQDNRKKRAKRNSKTR